MIVELSVDNLAIIEHAQLSFGPGFTVLTGETGAGKSLLIDAVELALGERADTELVRAGARSAAVRLVADLSASPDLASQCRDLGVPLEEGLLYVHREVFAEGRSQCRIGGKLFPVATLRQVGRLLVDLHGQHDHQSLLDPERHVGFLDRWIGEAASQALAQVSDHYVRAEEARRNLEAIRRGLRDREQRIDMLRFQVGEIEAVSPLPGEMEELEAQLSRLKHTERLMGTAGAALSALADAEGCAADQLGESVRQLEDATRIDASLEPVVDPLREALYRLQDGIHALRAYVDALEADPNLLEEVAGRIDALRRLRRKYGDDEVQVLAFLEQARQELATLEDSEASEESLARSAAESRVALERACAELTQLRKHKATVFAEQTQAQLQDLGMAKAVFTVDFREKPPGPDGADQVEFFFSANAGEPPRPLSKIASGGEISRVMLAIKTTLAGRAGVPTLVFDEVDAGLGGRAAATVARKLEELAAFTQVLVISHLPQIAARATEHYHIEKAEQGGRVVTRVRRLSQEERVQEIARMLAGEQVTPSALANARELLVQSAP